MQPVPQSNPPRLSAAVQSFLIYCESRNLSPRTVGFYGEKLRECIRLLDDPPVTQVTTDQLRHLVVYWTKLHKRCPQLPQRDRGTGLAATTVNGYIRSLRVLFRYLTDEGILAQSPATKLQLLKTPEFLGTALDPPEVESMVRWRAPATYHFRRDKALCLLLLDTGIRVGEAVALRLQDVSWADRTLTVFGKGRKVRVVPFGRQSARALSSYLAARPSDTRPEAALFLTSTGNPLTVWRARHIVRLAAARAGLHDKAVSPHMLRRTFATMWISHGGDPFSLQRILGHTTMEMVNRYVRLTTTDLRARHSAIGPVDHIVPSSGRVVPGPRRRQH